MTPGSPPEADARLLAYRGLLSELADTLPDAEALATWKAFIAKLQMIPELRWIKHWLRHEIPSLRVEDAPLLVVVKFAEDWARAAVGKKPPHDVRYDFGLRLYFYDPGGTVEEFEALVDLLERANAVLLRALRSEYMACYGNFWQEVELVGGRKTGRTTFIDKNQERLYATTHLRLLRRFRPGQ